MSETRTDIDGEIDADVTEKLETDGEKLADKTGAVGCHVHMTPDGEPCLSLYFETDVDRPQISNVDMEPCVELQYMPESIEYGESEMNGRPYMQVRLQPIDE
jgi:hypothetical protein